jgi:hypothetical protein
LRQCEWVVYAKRPFAGPEAVLAYLSRYTHLVAISNSLLVSLDEGGVTFRWKEYRVEGPTRHKMLTLEAGEFMRRFLLYVLPSRFRAFVGNVNDGTSWLLCVVRGQESGVIAAGEVTSDCRWSARPSVRFRILDSNQQPVAAGFHISGR